MHHLHEQTVPCYHESLHNVLVQLRSDLQIATRIFLCKGYFLEELSFCLNHFWQYHTAPACRNIHFLIFSLISADLKSRFKRNRAWESVCLLCVLGFEPKQDFVNESRRLYHSEPAVLESLQQINDWVEKATNGRMAGFLSALPPNLLLMLINAVHFKGEMSPYSYD